MSKICQISGKRAMFGNNVSKAINKTKRRFEVNLISKKFFLPSQNKWINLKVSARTLKTINKNGIEARNGFISLNKMKPFKKYSKINLPISNYLSENSISLPTSINLTKNQIKYIVDLLILNIEELTNVK